MSIIKALLVISYWKHNRIFHLESIQFIFIFIVMSACSQKQHLKISEQINITNDDRAYSVSTIAVNPLNSKEMVVAVMRWEDLREGQFKYNVTTYISDDGGISWNESVLPKITGQTTSIGASVEYSKKGTVYISYSASIPDKRRSIIVFHSSTDNGKNWTNTTTINTLFNELPKLTIDNDENIYITSYGRARDSLLDIENREKSWALILANSTDLGKTFNTKGIAIDNNLNLGSFKLTKFSNGELWFPFTQFKAGDTSKTVQSTIYGTRIFKKEIKIEDIDKVVTTKRRITYMVNTATDKSNFFKDRLYLTYSVGPRDSMQTAVIYSKNKGRSWSNPNILKANGKGYFSRLPKIAVSKNGVVGVTWVQTETIDNKCWRVYFSYSKDGGNTFTEPITISKLSCPNSDEVINSNIGNGFLSKYYTYGGDYMGLSPTDNGFQAVWVDTSNSHFQLYITNIDLH